MTTHSHAEDGTILQVAALLGIASVGRMQAAVLIQALPFKAALSQALVARTLSRGLLERGDDGYITLSKGGRNLLCDGDTEPLQAVVSTRKRTSVTGTDSLRQRAWNAMRLSSRFTVGGLVILAGRSEAAPAANLKMYVGALSRAGYLLPLPIKVHTPGGCRGIRQWRLVRDTGSSAPVHRRDKGELYDPNTDQIVPLPAGARHVA